MHRSFDCALACAPAPLRMTTPAGTATIDQPPPYEEPAEHWKYGRETRRFFTRAKGHPASRRARRRSQKLLHRRRQNHHRQTTLRPGRDVYKSSVRWAERKMGGQIGEIERRSRAGHLSVITRPLTVDTGTQICELSATSSTLGNQEAGLALVLLQRIQQIKLHQLRIRVQEADTILRRER